MKFTLFWGFSHIFFSADCSSWTPFFAKVMSQLVFCVFIFGLSIDIKFQSIVELIQPNDTKQRIPLGLSWQNKRSSCLVRLDCFAGYKN